MKKLLAGATLLNYLGVAGVIVIMLATTADVSGRFLLNRPLPGVTEITESLMVVLVFFAAAYTLRVGGHVRADLLINHLPARVRLGLDAVGLLLLVVAAGLIVWQSADATVWSWQKKETTDVVRLPLYLVKSAIPLGALFLGLEGAILFAGCLRRLAGRSAGELAVDAHPG